MWRPRILFLICIVIISCQKEVLDSEVQRVVEEQLVVFDRNQNPPVALTDILDDSEIVIFGETHYVQQHQDFVVSLLPVLHAKGYRVIFDELFHGFSWMVEDYINGEISVLPEFILYFNETLIEGVKAFNSQVPERERFRLVYMDVNHWVTNFTTCILEIEKILGTQPAFSSLKGTGVDSDVYLNSLQGIYQSLISDREQFISMWGTQWYERILNVFAVEIESSKFRRNRIDRDREAVMYDNIVTVMRELQNAKVVINTGMFHGQKKTFMGNQIPRLGQLFMHENSRTSSIAFVGLRGEIKRRYDDAQNITIDLPHNASADDLVKAVDQMAGDEMSLMPLSDVVFSGNVKVSYDYATTVTAPIGRQFDAMITYPQISTLHSMDVYDYQ